MRTTSSSKKIEAGVTFLFRSTVSWFRVHKVYLESKHSFSLVAWLWQHFLNKKESHKPSMFRVALKQIHIWYQSGSVRRQPSLLPFNISKTSTMPTSATWTEFQFCINIARTKFGLRKRIYLDLQKIKTETLSLSPIRWSNAGHQPDTHSDPNPNPEPSDSANGLLTNIILGITAWYFYCYFYSEWFRCKQFHQRTEPRNSRKTPDSFQPSEYTLNSRLGYISLTTASSTTTRYLAVAFEYSIGGACIR